jgi:hypothetical protein
MGKVISCPNCKTEFLADKSTLYNESIAEKNLSPERRKEDSLSYKASILWSRISSKGRIGIIGAVIILVGLLIGIPISQNNKKQAEFNKKYEEFTFEADQLASLTSYGINKGDFSRQLARVKAKWDKIPSGGFKGEAYSNFWDAMSKWRESIIYWDSEYTRDQVPRKLGEASEFYDNAKREMR